MKSFFSHISFAPPDPILGLMADFLTDPRQDKVNLSIGVYQTEEGKTPIMRSVHLAEKLLLESEESKVYLPIEGDPFYLEEVLKLVLGEPLYSFQRASFCILQTPGGGSALRLGAEFAKQEIATPCAMPEPTWPNHRGIFSQCGIEILNYSYYDFEKKQLDFPKMLSALKLLPPKTLVLFHVNCHNPSGADLKKEEWKELAEFLKKQELIPFFDAAYLGFDRSFQEDVYPIRLFVELGIEFLLALSFSKNFSLYAERIGAFLLFSNEHTAPKALSQLKLLARRNYSNPPQHGAKIIAKILSTKDLWISWEEELFTMRQRIALLREKFVAALASHGSKVDYSYLLDKKGLFSFCNLSKTQVKHLKDQHGIYMTGDGRLNIAGLNRLNLDKVVTSLISVEGSK
jgi:aspartate aminotransferase